MYCEKCWGKGWEIGTVGSCLRGRSVLSEQSIPVNLQHHLRASSARQASNVVALSIES